MSEISNTIQLKLLENRTIVAFVEDRPFSYEGGYRIIAGEEGATRFQITSVPEKYKDCTFSVEMVNSQGYGLNKVNIEKNEQGFIPFGLPVGMAVAGYGQILIRAEQGNASVPFLPLKIKVYNTLPEWKQNISESPMATKDYVDENFAKLDENGKVSASQLPSYIDDIVEYDTKSAFPATGDKGIIYLDLSTNLTWRWSGSTYVEFGETPDNYVTTDTEQTIFGYKTFIGSVSYRYYHSETDYSEISIAPRGGFLTYRPNLQADTYIIDLPQKSGNLVVDSDLDNYVDKSTDQYISGHKTFFQLEQRQKGSDDTFSSLILDSSLGAIIYTPFPGTDHYNLYLPEKHGKLALKEDIADCATHSDLAILEDRVDVLEKITSQAVSTKTTVEDTYSTRETGGGLNVVDDVPTVVDRIGGDTIKTSNLFDINGTVKNGGAVLRSKTENTIILAQSGSGAWRSYWFEIPNGKSLTGKTVTFNGKFKSSGANEGGIRLQWVGNDGVSVEGMIGMMTTSNTPMTKTIPTPPTETSKLYIILYSNVDATGLDPNTTYTVTYSDIMLNEGSTALPYSPYFKGLKNGSFKGIVSGGVNLFDINAEKFSGYATLVSKTETTIVVSQMSTTSHSVNFVIPNGRTFINKTVTLQGNITPSSINKGGMRIAWMEPNMTTVASIVRASQSGVAATGIITTPPTAACELCIMFYSNDQGTGLEANTRYLVTYSNIMLNIGDTAQPYTPYIEPDTSFALENKIELPKYDYIDVAAKKHIVNSATIEFDGTESWELHTNSSTEQGVVFKTEIGDSYIGLQTSICTNYKNVNQAWDPPYKTTYGIYSDNGFVKFKYFRAPNSSITTVDQWKAYLADRAAKGDPITLTYKTATSTATDINLPSSYTVHKHGTETINQGTDSNEQYGTKLTVKQQYYTIN